jgi:uncharacterized FAD-dependent dehydrogenase
VLTLSGLRVALADERPLAEIAAAYLRLAPSAAPKIKILGKAIDARRKDRISFVYKLGLLAEDENGLLKKYAGDKNLALYQPPPPVKIVYGKQPAPGRIVIAGAGPAGLFAALTLAEHGYKPLIVERGLPVGRRVGKVADFWQRGEFSPEASVQFGEGGAGTFSDGKLTTRINDPASGLILRRLAACGAPPEIEYCHKPHIGTDLLRRVVGNLSRLICESGGEIRYETRLSDIKLKNGRMEKAALSGEYVDCAALVVATGHSARDVYGLLLARGFALSPKPFSIGVRIEHPQEVIDRAQYGVLAGHPKLGAADYSLAWHDKGSGRGVYSFCMCPGGVVIASCSGEEEIVTNGMSYRRRDSSVANSALAVGVAPPDFGFHPLAGVEFQRRWEKLAFAKAGGGYHAPAQTVGSFLSGGRPVADGQTAATYRPGIRPVSLREVLPGFVTDALAAALPLFGRKIKGFDAKGALLTGVETRTSAPLWILRDPESRQAQGKTGVYPAGEGAGYAGGIMSAALDGYYTALAIMKKYRQT